MSRAWKRRGVCVVGAQPYVTNFNIQVEGASLEDEATASMAFYARVFALKVGK